MMQDQVISEERAFNPYLVFQGVFIQNHILQNEWTDSEKLMYGVLQPLMAEDSDEETPTVYDLMERLHWAESKVRRVLLSLHKKGLI